MKTQLRQISSLAAIMVAALPAGTALSLVTAAPASAQSATQLELLSIGRGKQINLPSTITDVFIADPEIADVDVKSPTQIYIFGRGQGETTLYATDANGRTVYSSTIRVGGNIDSIDQMLRLTMPDAKISTATMNGIVLLTGSVAKPADAEEAERLVQAFVGEKTQVVSRLTTATPLQVNLRVRIAEVNRTLSKEINSNLATRDNTNGFQFGLFRGRNTIGISDFDTSALPQLDASALYGLPAGTLSLPFDPASGQFVTGGSQYDVTQRDGDSLITLAGQLFGLDIGAAFDLTEKAGLTVTLAEPNLTTVSGETAEFLAGGEFPIPVSQGLGNVSVEYRDYGVSLSYTPTVLSNGRISLRVRPEVSDITTNGAVTIGGFQVPGIVTRRAETTVELGSGQSFMIAGLLNNSSSSTADKIPGIGDVPIIGNLFKSNGWRKNETELVIVVTPYLVKPVDDSQIKLPTDGFQAPNDAQRLLLGQTSDGKSGGTRPMPTAVDTTVTTPGFAGSTTAPKPSQAKAQPNKKKKSAANSSGPGFSFE